MSDCKCDFCGEPIDGKAVSKLFSSITIGGKTLHLLFKVSKETEEGPSLEKPGVPAELCERCLYEILNLWNHDIRRTKPDLWDDDEAEEYADEEADAVANELLKHVRVSFFND